MASKSGEEIRSFVETVVKALVDHPDKVVATAIESETMVVVELTVVQEDMGVLIGREGRNAQSLRTLLTAMATKNRKKGVLQILDVRGPRPPRKEP